jgi:hypothetical protein
MSDGTVTVGGVVSVTVTLKEPLAEFPEASVAVHVTVVCPTPKVLPEAWSQLTPGLGSMASEADTEKLTAAPPRPVAGVEMSPGTVIEGAPVSDTVTPKEALPVLPWPSVAVQVTVVVPRPNVLPELGLQSGVSEPLTESEAEAEKVTVAPPGPVAAAETESGTLTLGSVVSWTVIVKLTELSPSTFDALHVTVVCPKSKVLPDDGEQLTGLPSVASGPPQDADAPPGPVASTVWSPGTFSNAGGSAPAERTPKPRAATSATATNTLRRCTFRTALPLSPRPSTEERGPEYHSLAETAAPTGRRPGGLM